MGRVTGSLPLANPASILPVRREDEDHDRFFPRLLRAVRLARALSVRSGGARRGVPKAADGGAPRPFCRGGRRRAPARASIVIARQRSVSRAEEPARACALPAAVARHRRAGGNGYRASAGISGTAAGVSRIHGRGGRQARRGCAHCPAEKRRERCRRTGALACRAARSSGDTGRGASKLTEAQVPVQGCRRSPRSTIRP